MSWINTTPKRIRGKIVFYVVLYTLAALLLISFLSILPLVEQLKKSEERSLLNIAEIRSMAVEEYLLRVRNIALQVSARMGIGELEGYYRGQLNRSQLHLFTTPRLEGALLHPENLVGITRLDREEKVIARAGVTLPVDPVTIPQPGTNDVAILDPQVIGDMLYLVAAVPIAGDDQERLGTDVIFFTIHYLQRIAWEYTRSGEETLLGRMAEDQAILFFPGRLGQVEIYNQVTPYPLYFVALQEAADGRSGLLRYPEKTVQPDFVAYAPISDTGWGLLVTIHERQLFAPVNRTLINVAAMVVLLTACGGIGIYLLLRPLTGQVLEYWTRLENANQDLQQEISERRRAEENLRRSENEWKETFEAITDSVAIFDIDGRLLKMNRATRAFLAGRKPANADISPLDLFPSEKPESLFDRMLRSSKQESEEVFDTLAQRHLQVTVFPLFDEKGEIWGGVHVARDITEQKNIEKMKDEMLSAVSHEMRTPLTAMLGFVDFLLNHEVKPDQQREFLQTVRRETERLNDLISNFLDLQRLQADLETYHFEPTAPCNLLGEAVQLFAAASKKHRILIDCPPDLPLVRGDQQRLHQVIKNLMSNAIRYSPSGGDVTVRASRQGEMIEFQVRDEGMGIPSQVLTRIFDRFYRVDDSSRRIPGGIGLGLTMVREIIRAHGGRVWAESTLGEGSTFYFTVPVIENQVKG